MSLKKVLNVLHNSPIAHSCIRMFTCFDLSLNINDTLKNSVSTEKPMFYYPINHKFRVDVV